MLYLPGEFLLEQDLCYLNHAAIGPWPRRTAQVVAQMAQQIMSRGGSDYPDWLETEQRLRGRIVSLIRGGQPADIALVKNTSEGLSIISQGLDWATGDTVVGIAHDFCSNEMVWQVLAARGVIYHPVDALAADDPEQVLIDALDMDVPPRLLAVSSVHFATGYRFDLQRLAEACRARGVLLSIDLIQSLGALPFDQATIDADFITCGGHKWLMSAEGQGFFYCRPALRERLRLHQFGWAMRAAPYAFEDTTWAPAPSARRFEPGTPNMLGIHALDASLSLFEEVGMDEVGRRLAERVERLIGGLTSLPGIELVTPSDPDRRAGIVTFRHPHRDRGSLHAALMGKAVICSERCGGVRLSPHFYTPDAVIDRALQVVEDLL
jgi:cysteine desulfurase / selenocysteine lyase